MSTPEHHTETIQKLAVRIHQAGMQAPATLFLDIMQPFDFLSTQVVLFVKPFVRGFGWEQYAAALTEENGWQELRRMLEE
jgi:hypothetical protein